MNQRPIHTNPNSLGFSLLAANQTTVVQVPRRFQNASPPMCYLLRCPGAFRYEVARGRYAAGDDLHKSGLDIALEALRLYRKRRDFQVDTVVKYARICRVERVMRPYLVILL
jgi:hypothetical protein